MNTNQPAARPTACWLARLARQVGGWPIPFHDNFRALENAWTRYVGLPVFCTRGCFVRGKWKKQLAHNSNYDVAKTLELILRS
eukprot:COSAG01_NODE_830_length_13271_cov_2.845278_2_plen_83_part_00